MIIIITFSYKALYQVVTVLSDQLFFFKLRPLAFFFNIILTLSFTISHVYKYKKIIAGTFDLNFYSFFK